MHKRTLGLVALVLATLIGLSGCGSPIAPTEAQADVVPTVTSERSDYVLAEASVEAAERRNVAFQIGGRVVAILVQEGQTVQAGDVLVRLEAGALERAAATAEQNLIIQQANLDTLLAGATDVDIAAARAALHSAEESLQRVREGAEKQDVAAAEAHLAAARETLQKLLNGPDELDLAQVKARMQRTEAALKEAQAYYDEVSWRTDIGALPQATQYQSATIEYEAAKAAYEDAAAGADADQIAQARASLAQAEATVKQLADSPKPAEVAAAEAAVAQAQALLTTLLDGATDESLAIARAQVEQATIGLEDARDTLGKATLTAPFDVTVTKIHVEEGDLVSGGQIVVTVATTGQLQVRTTDLTESDVVYVAVGQPAVVTVDALPGVELVGHVSEIGLDSVDYRGDVTYPVVVVLDEADPRLKLGMTAEVKLARDKDGAAQ